MSKTGFIITSHAVDTSRGMELHFHGTTGEHRFKLILENQKVVFFILKESEFSPTNIKFERKSGGLKNFSHKEVDTIYLHKSSDIQTVKEYCQSKGIRTFELDIRPAERFLMERFIKGEISFQGDVEIKHNIHIYRNPQVSASTVTTPLSILCLDIETGSDGRLYSIGYEYRNSHKTRQNVLMLSEQSRKVNEWFTTYDSEEKVILAFLQELKALDPTILCGWHVIGFDLMFLEKKCQSLGISFTIGIEDSKPNMYERKGAGFFAQVKGRVVIDGPPTLRGAFYKFSDFKLETVAQEVLKVGKDIASDTEKVLEIERRFREDKLALAKYNLLDCTLVLDIFDKLQIIDLVHKRSMISGLLIDRLSVSTAAFDFLYLPFLHRRGFVAPNRVEMLREDASTGGLVIEPSSGLHENVAIFDFKSLYPTLMTTFMIDPLGRVLETDQKVTTPSGHDFSSENPILPEILKDLLSKREDAKTDNKKALSQAIKILMNSFYGILGSPRCRFYHSDLPDAITQTGQYILREAMSFFKEESLEIVYGDTDSVFVKFSQTPSKEQTQQLARKLNRTIRTSFREKFDVESYLECEFEKCFDLIYFSKARNGEGAAKKRYAGLVGNEVEFTGMEVVRSDWTRLAKIFQTKIYEKFFSGVDIKEYIKSFIQDLESGFYDQDLVYTKRLSKPPKEYVKNIPVHVKAALKVDHKGPYRLKQVSYVITKSGPEPIESSPTSFDYNHYIEKQLKPIADDILTYQNTSFDSLILGDQLSLL